MKIDRCKEETHFGVLGAVLIDLSPLARNRSPLRRLYSSCAEAEAIKAAEIRAVVLILSAVYDGSGVVR